MAFNPTALRILGEIGSISVGGAATSLSDFTEKTVVISTPMVQVLPLKKALGLVDPADVMAKIDYTSGLLGTNILVLKQHEALQFSRMMLKTKLGIEETEWVPAIEDALAEVCNMMMGAVAAALSHVLNEDIDIGVPAIYRHGERGEWPCGAEKEMVVIWFEIRLEQEMTMVFLQIIPVEQAAVMLRILEGGTKE